MLQNDSIQKAVRTMNGRILEGWARTRTPSGLLYYLNHRHGITQWDHPEYIRIFNEMLPINTVRYAAYRTACKLRHLQTHLKFHEMSLHCVASAFDCAGLRAPENNDIVPSKEIERVILYIYRTSYKSKPVDVSLCTDLMVNIILNTYDENRSGNIQVLKCKVLLVVMCGGRLQEKYRYLFNQIADHNNCCTRRALAKLLQCLASITELLSEQLSFGVSLVPAAVKSCFKEIEGDIGITEDAFLMWLLQEPQTLVWWTTLYRLSSAELVCHDIKCGACKQHPIIGLRYQCLKCLGYNLCQDCFLHGRKSRSHKLSHPIQEYCHESTGKEWRQSIIKILMHRLKSSNDFKPRYLTISSNSGQTLKSLLQDTESESSSVHPQNSQRRPTTATATEGISPEGSNSTDEGEQITWSRTICQSVENLDKLEEDSSDLSTSSNNDPPEPIVLPPSPSQEIHSIIKHLEDGQRQLCSRLDTDNSPPIPSQLVEQHTAELQTQINKLKTILQQYSKYSKCPKQKDDGTRMLSRMESTPIVGERGLHLSLSPIAAQDNLNDTAVQDNKENHYTETRHGVVSNSSTIRNTCVSDLHVKRITLSTISDGQQNSVSFREKGLNEALQKHGKKLPSFTEMNWSDLTPSTTMTSSSSTSDKKEKETKEEKLETGWKTRQSLNVLEEEETEERDDEQLAQAKDELDKILTRLQQIIPFGTGEKRNSVRPLFSPAPAGVITAAHEIGDAMAIFVERIPRCREVEDHVNALTSEDMQVSQQDIKFGLAGKE